MRGWIFLLSLLTLLALAPALNGATAEKAGFYTLGAVFGVLTAVCLAASAGRGTE